MAAIFLDTPIALQTEKDANEAINFLITGRYLIREDVYDKDDRYSRYTLFYAMSGANYAKAQKILANKHVIIAGCGGIGNVKAANLATAGIGKLTLVDNGFIEVSILTR